MEAAPVGLCYTRGPVAIASSVRGASFPVRIYSKARNFGLVDKSEIPRPAGVMSGTDGN